MFKDICKWLSQKVEFLCYVYKCNVSCISTASYATATLPPYVSDLPNTTIIKSVPECIEFARRKYDLQW